MQQGIKLLTLNVEGHKHIHRVQKLISELKPDVVCLQEVFLADVPTIQSVLGIGEEQTQFVPTLFVDKTNGFGFDPLGLYGIAAFSRLPVVNKNHSQYLGDPNQVPLINDQDSNTPNRVLAWIEVLDSVGKTYTFAHTHFTWSPGGEVIALQQETLALLLQSFSSTIAQGVLCGDFNAPRGGEIYQQLRQHFTDAIPGHITTTLDQELHRVPGLQLVVDYIFTTPNYLCQEVQLFSGVSDHQAVLGIVSQR